MGKLKMYSKAAGYMVLSGMLFLGGCGKEPQQEVDMPSPAISGGEGENTPGGTGDTAPSGEDTQDDPVPISSTPLPDDTDDTNVTDTSGTGEPSPENAWLLGSAEYIEKYIKIEDIGQYGMGLLRQMNDWCEGPHDGTFIAEGWNTDEQAVADRLAEATDKTACWIVSRDFNGDGSPEAFAYVCNLTWHGGIEVWFAASDGTVYKMEEENDFDRPYCIEMPGNTFIVYSISGADHHGYFMYGVEGNVAEPALDCYHGVELLENGHLRVTDWGYDAWSPADNYGEDSCSYSNGITKNYYYYYDENGFHEYGGALVTEEGFCQYENGFEILGAIRKGGNIVKDIYYYADGRMVVNYVEDKVQYYDTDEEPYRDNYYLQVPILSEGEGGFVLAWEDSIDITTLQGKPKGGEHDIFIGCGIYQPAYAPELADYPDYQPPFEYYRREYSGLSKGDFKICVIDAAVEDRPKRGEVVASGEDLSGISRHNLVFSFTWEYLDAAKAKNEELGDAASIGAGALLGLPSHQTAIGIWIGDEYICGGSLLSYTSYDAIGFMGTDQIYFDEPSVYYNHLAFSDSEDARYFDVFSAEAAVKIHAFAEAVGLHQAENVLEILSPGTYCTEQEYLVDLNGDGVKENLFYGENSLLINGRNYIGIMGYRDNADVDSFFIWDIDPEDGILEIGIWVHGPSNDEGTSLYWYDGETLRPSGRVEGPWQSQYGSDIFFDGAGGLQTQCRLGILQTWWAPMNFLLDEQHWLVRMEQELYYPIEWHDEVHAYTLLQPIRLYQSRDTSSDYEIAQVGERLALLATDNKCFVLAETENGVQGYFYLEDGFQIEDPAGGHYDWTTDVIGGLNFAD